MPVVTKAEILAHQQPGAPGTTTSPQVSYPGGPPESLYRLTRSLLRWCEEHQISLSARHTPGRLNVTSDPLSRRHQLTQTDGLSVSGGATDMHVSPLSDLQSWKQDALRSPRNGL